MLLRSSILLLLAGSKSLLAFSRHFQVATKKPIILLDVDNVINMFYERDPKSIWEDTTEQIVNGFRIVYSPTVVRKINEWNKIAEVRWLTAWNQKAVIHLSPALNFDTFRLAEGRESDENNECKLSKTESAMATAEEVGPDGCVIWIDDHIKSFMRSKESIFSRPNTVLLCPYYGLTKEHIAFVDSILADPELSRGKLLQNIEAYR
jgi:hypothetical protein